MANTTDKCDRRLINFPATREKAAAFRAGSKSEICVLLGMRPSGVSLYRIAANLSDREGKQWGSAVSPAYARAWVAPSYLGVKGYACASEHKTVADYLSSFEGDELKAERACLPKGALEKPGEHLLLVVRISPAGGTIDNSRPDAAKAAPTEQPTEQPAAPEAATTTPNMAKAKAKHAAKQKAKADKAKAKGSK